MRAAAALYRRRNQHWRARVKVAAGLYRHATRERPEGRLFFVDRLANRVKDKQVVARRRNPSEQVHLREHSELARLHLMASEQDLVPRKVPPDLRPIFPLRRRAIRGDQRAGLRMSEQKERLARQPEHIADPAQQTERRPPSIILEVGDVAWLDAEFHRQLALRQSKLFASPFQ